MPFAIGAKKRGIATANPARIPGPAPYTTPAAMMPASGHAKPDRAHAVERLARRMGLRVRDTAAEAQCHADQQFGTDGRKSFEGVRIAFHQHRRRDRPCERGADETPCDVRPRERVAVQEQDDGHPRPRSPPERRDRAQHPSLHQLTLRVAPRRELVRRGVVVPRVRLRWGRRAVVLAVATPAEEPGTNQQLRVARGGVAFGPRVRP